MSCSSEEREDFDAAPDDLAGAPGSKLLPSGANRLSGSSFALLRNSRRRFSEM